MRGGIRFIGILLVNVVLVYFVFFVTHVVVVAALFEVNSVRALLLFVLSFIYLTCLTCCHKLNFNRFIVARYPRKRTYVFTTQSVPSWQSFLLSANCESFCLSRYTRTSHLTLQRLNFFFLFYRWLLLDRKGLNIRLVDIGQGYLAHFLGVSGT